MRKIILVAMVAALMVSCKDGVLVNSIDKNVNATIGKKQQTDTVEYTTVTVANVTYKFIKVEGGTFQMGEAGWEEPVHSVTLSTYYIGETEVTQTLWIAVMGNNPSKFNGDDLPVEQVRWSDCQEFVTKLNQLTGKTFALPTEAQWEYAARGGNKSNGYAFSGSNTADDVAWYYDNSSNKTHQVGTKKANELGLYDMSGNVAEWCSDWYDDYSSSAQTDPVGPSAGSLRVMRGSFFYESDIYCRSTARNHGKPDYVSCHNGLRLVLMP